MSREMTTDDNRLKTDVLDHAREFVSIIIESAPQEYEKLLKLSRFKRLIRESNTFNYGKLFTYAEYLVFKSEFNKRFPDMSARVCINEFCKLLLKNDISITNLVNYIEGSSGEELLILKGRERLREGEDA